MVHFDFFCSLFLVVVCPSTRERKEGRREGGGEEEIAGEAERYGIAVPRGKHCMICMLYCGRAKLKLLLFLRVCCLCQLVIH